LDWHPAIEQLEDRKLLSATSMTSWNPVLNGGTGAPVPVDDEILLSDGTVMAHAVDPVNPYSADWYKLTPDASGNYNNGTWAQIASMSIGRGAFVSNVLPDGRVFVLGGEYSSDGGFTNTGEIYNPVTNTWTLTADFPQPIFGDDPTEILPNGTILAGYALGPQTYIYSPTSNTWTQTGTKLRNDASDEENWVMLPNGDVLSYDIFASITNSVPTAQKYDPTKGIWENAGKLPYALSSKPDFELGPPVLLQNGKVWEIGASTDGGVSRTAFYNPSNNKWTKGPNLPTLNSPFTETLTYQSSDDAPAAILPDGNVIFVADSPPSLSSPPSAIFEYHPSTNKITQVDTNLYGSSAFLPTDFLTSTLKTQPAFFDRMLMLPNGQMLFSNSSNFVYTYSEPGPTPATKPVVTSITQGAGSVYTLTGKGLNGLNEGSSFGDDAENSSNYPIVYVTDAAGNVTYARTSNWSLTGVRTGNQVETVNFTLPASILNGTYTLHVSGAGVSSVGTPVTISASGLAIIVPPPKGGFTANSSTTKASPSGIMNSINVGLPALTTSKLTSPASPIVVPAPKTKPTVSNTLSSVSANSLAAHGLSTSLLVVMG
jgi:hypothetical protein